jgi:hypothetical protein
MSNEKIKKCPQPSYSCDPKDYNFKGRPKKDNSKRVIYFLIVDIAGS